MKKSRVFTAIGKSTPVHVLLGYHCMCNSRDGYYRAKKQLRDHAVSTTEKIEDKQRERAWTQHNTETIDVPAMAASAAYDPSARVPVRHTPSPHLGRRWVRSVLSKMTAKGLRLSTLCSFILELRRPPIVRHPLSSLAIIVRSHPCVLSSAACSPHC